MKLEEARFPLLMQLIVERGITQVQIAKELDITYRAFRNKMTGASPITWDEVCAIQGRFFPDISKDELFKHG